MTLFELMGRQANPFQVPTDGPRLGDRSHDLHLPPAPITYAQRFPESGPESLRAPVQNNRRKR